MRLAYLTSRYPAPSHAFIQREILALRELGLEIDVFALKRAAADQVLSDADRREYETTYAIQPPRVARVLADHLSAFASAPGRYLSTLAGALRLATGGARALVWQLFYFAEAIHLERELRRRGLDHVHVHFANPAAEVAMHAARYGAPRLTWSLTLHGSAEFEDVHRLHLAAKLRSAERVACNTDWTRSQAMIELGSGDWERLEVVRLGLDTSEWEPPARAGGDGDGARPLRVLTVGRLEPVKAQAGLIEAVAQLAGEGLDVHLTIAGEGPERAALERLVDRLGVHTRVALPGAVGQDTIRELYAQSDAFCLPSLRESFGVVLMEAMAMELPVVATRQGGVVELVEDGHSGLLVAPGRPDELAAALRRLASDAPLRRELGRAGRASVQERYELSRQIELKRGFLARLLQPR